MQTFQNCVLARCAGKKDARGTIPKVGGRPVNHLPSDLRDKVDKIIFLTVFTFKTVRGPYFIRRLRLKRAPNPPLWKTFCGILSLEPVLPNNHFQSSNLRHDSDG